MNSAKGRDLHTRAEHARELEQNFTKALSLIDEATIAYSKDSDYLGMAEAQASRFITLKHLYRDTKDNAFLILANFAAKSAVEIAELSKIPEAIALPYFNLGKAYEEQRDYKKATTYFEKALNLPLPESHDRPAVRADIKAHLAYAKYKSGDKSALKLMDNAIGELENSEEMKYNKDVWASGAHLRAAEMLRDDDLQEAKEHLSKAKKIIDTNLELKLRKEQLEKLERELP